MLFCVQESICIACNCCLLLKSGITCLYVIVDFGVQEGTGITKLIPHLSPEGQDLLQKLLMYNPEDRISAKQALRHAFFREIRSDTTCPHPRLLPHYYST